MCWCQCRLSLFCAYDRCAFEQETAPHVVLPRGLLHTDATWRLCRDSGAVAEVVFKRWRYVINGIITALTGITDLPGWVSNPKYALGTLIILSVWQFGSSMIIFLAGLKQISWEYRSGVSSLTRSLYAPAASWQTLSRARWRHMRLGGLSSS